MGGVEQIIGEDCNRDVERGIIDRVLRSTGKLSMVICDSQSRPIVLQFYLLDFTISSFNRRYLFLHFIVGFFFPGNLKDGYFHADKY